MPIERNDVTAPLWRKKVDGSLVRLGYTPLPLWVAAMWSVPDAFADVSGRGDARATIDCRFDGVDYSGEIVPHKGGRHHRLFLQEELRLALAARFPMSYLRELEVRLALASGAAATRRDDAPSARAFWEFVDLEFDVSARRMRLVAHYVQRADFPNLFARLAGSAPLKSVEDEVRGRRALRIHKQPWRPRSEFESEIGARNVVYTLRQRDGRAIRCRRRRRGRGVEHAGTGLPGRERTALDGPDDRLLHHSATG